MIIEVDGGYHSKLEQAHMDEMRELCLKDYGIKVIRFKNEEILDNIENVLKVIESLLNSSGKNQ